MRAVRVHRHGEPAEALQLDDDVAVPEPGPDQVRMRVEATALSMPDVMLCRGGYPLTPRELPFVPGMEASGVVSALGEGVDPAVAGAAGRRLRASSPTARSPRRRWSARAGLYPVPDAVSPAATAATTHIGFTTAHAGLHRRAELKAGETLLVTCAAAGGTGNAAVQLGAVAGARVIATAAVTERRQDVPRSRRARRARRAQSRPRQGGARGERRPRRRRRVRPRRGRRPSPPPPVASPARAASWWWVSPAARRARSGPGTCCAATTPSWASTWARTAATRVMGDENRRYMLAMHDEIMEPARRGPVPRPRSTGRPTSPARAAALTDLAARKVTGRPVVRPDVASRARSVCVPQRARRARYSVMPKRSRPKALMALPRMNR